jgi:hypothetical protein
LTGPVTVGTVMVADTAVKESPSGTVAIAPLHMFELRLLGPTTVSKCDQQDGNISYYQRILGHNEREGLTLGWTGIADSKRESAKDRPEKIEEAFIVIVECARRIQLISWVIQLMVG